MSRSGTELPTKDEPAGNQRFAKQPAKLFGPLFPEGYAPQGKRTAMGRRLSTATTLLRNARRPAPRPSFRLRAMTLD